MILRENQIGPKSGQRMQAIRRILEGRQVKDLGLFLVASVAISSRNEMDKEDHRMRVIHRHANLGGVPLPENIGKDQRMLIDNAVFVAPFFHDSERKFVELLLFNVVDEAARCADRLSRSHSRVLMQNLEMGRIHGVLHRLKPIRVEKRIDDYLSSPILSDPDVVLGYERSRFRAHVGPVEANKLLDRISLVLHRQIEPALPRLRRALKAISFDVVEPAVISTSDPSLFDPAVEKRDAAMRTAIGQKTHSALLVPKQYQIFA